LQRLMPIPVLGKPLNCLTANRAATKAQRHKEGVWIISLYQKSVMSVASCQLSVAKDEKGG